MDKRAGKGIAALRAARLIAAAAFLILAGLVCMELYEYRQGEQSYTTLRQNALTQDEAADGESGAQENPIDFDALLSINPDCVAWIYACDGEIDYPVVRSDDDSYYLTHTFDGSVNSAGCIFADRYAQEPFADFQTILYGHNMKNGTMFHALLSYRDKEYWEEHQTVTVYLEGEIKSYRIFAAYYCAYEKLPIYDSVETQEEREAYIARVKALSLFDTGILPDAQDRLLTLVTCEYSGDDYRMAVHAVEAD